MDIIAITEQIRKKINEIDEIRKEIKERGEKKAITQSVYDKVLALYIIRLKNGEVFTTDDCTIQNPPATYLKDIAKGIVWKEKLEMEKADAEYKSLISNLEAVKAQLNALQTLNRHLDNI